jgi:enoyl-[acyl-carrier protein] reductase I
VGFLAGKRALIVGLATERSIAHGIAAAMHREGAELAFTYQGERLKDRVVEMAQDFGSAITLPMDVASDAEIDAAFAQIRTVWESLDIIVHSVAFAPREELAGGFVECTTRQGFQVAHDISSYSLTALAKAGRPLMQGRNGALITLSYLGAVRSIPSYNVMGLAKASLEANVRFLAADLGPENIRVNAISAGPIKTLAAAGVAGFRKMLGHVAAATPLRRNVTTAEVGNAAAFLCSDLASGITGEVLYVDAGYSHVGMSFPE